MKSPASTVRLGTIICLTAAIFTVIQLGYASWLNSLYYRNNGPFYDSMSYLDQLFRTWETSRDQGMVAGLRKSMDGTTCLPFVLIPPLADLVKPSRTLGIALQSLWVFFLYVSLAWFFIRHKGAGLAAGLSLPALFVSIAGIYQYNGGISDFRMDLQMYLGFGLCVTWFLIARSTRTTGGWIALGAICGLTCLARATAPVFLVLTLGAMLLVSWLTRRLTLADVGRAVIYAPAACVAVSGWFYILNWEHLHYYYFVWNLDANAHLPLALSREHFSYAFASTGAIIAWAGLLLYSLHFIPLKPTESSPPTGEKHAGSCAVDWAILFPALIPAGFLMMRGAGLNPFVSMPSAFGLVLLLVMAGRAWMFTATKACMAVALITLACTGTALGGIRAHTRPPGPYNQIDGYKQAWGLITSHSAGHKQREIKVAQLGLAYFCGPALLSYLTYDARLERRGGLVREGETQYELAGQLAYWGMLAAPADWARLPGASDSEKRAAIVDRFNREAAFLMVPTDATTGFLETNVRHNFINTQLSRLRQKILSDDRWERIGPEFGVSAQEHYILLRNRDLFSDGEARPQ